MSRRGQITIPRKLREKYGLRPDVEIELVETKEGLGLRRPVRGAHPVDQVAGVLGAGVDIDAYIDEVRGRSRPRT